jgi:hypothetical protein
MMRPFLAGIAACLTLFGNLAAQELYPPDGFEDTQPWPTPAGRTHRDPPTGPDELPAPRESDDEGHDDAAGPGEVLTRGPLHEAFAEPVSFNPQPGIIVPKQPPGPIEEQPPDQKPEGQDVDWISGYWAWDDDRGDFLWVSGIYRVLPLGRQWVPGYWHRVPTGHQWVPGFWTAVKSDVEYFPSPPKSIEVGPSSEPPSADHMWAPGHWTWHETRYVWRPGYWVVARPGWVWVPSHYLWTPRGYVFVPGYWDLVYERRGLVFAPVYFEPLVIVRPRFVYRPRVVISTGILTMHLFCRPAHYHYCFGDYYARSHLQVGIFPWFSFHVGRHGYCPAYAYHHWHHGHHRDVHWHLTVRREYEHRRDHAEARPPRTLVAQRTVINNIQNNVTVNRDVNIQQMTLAQPLSQAAGNRETGVRLERVNRQEQTQFRERARDVQRFQAERGRLESSVENGRSRDRNEGPSRLELRSPVASRSEGERRGDDRPGREKDRPDRGNDRPGRSEDRPARGEKTSPPRDNRGGNDPGLRKQAQGPQRPSSQGETQNAPRHGEGSGGLREGGASSPQRGKTKLSPKQNQREEARPEPHQGGPQERDEGNRGSGGPKQKHAGGAPQSRRPTSGKEGPRRKG